MGDIHRLLSSHLILENGTNWSLGRESLLCISQMVTPSCNTMETGIGYSTLVFGACQSRHTVCFPNTDVEPNVRQYASSADISMDRVTFLVGGSQLTLPRLYAEFNNLPIRTGLDFSLIDGDHAWPIPMIDFYYIASMTTIGGFILLDDIRIRSVNDVARFAESSHHWAIRKSLDDGRAVLIQKVSEGMGEWDKGDWFGIQEYNQLIIKYM